MPRRLPLALLVLTLLTVLVPPLAAQTDRRIADDHRFGCKSRDYLEELTGYAVAKDMEAFRKGLGAGLVIGECTLFRKGEEVFIVDTKIFSGLVKVRRKGAIEGYWTVLEAVKRPGT